MSVEKKLGKQFESDFQAILDVLKTKHRMTYVRLYDTTSAQGKYLPEQPGDYIVSAKGLGYLIECKASNKYRSLKSCLSSAVSTGQAASMRLWHRSQSPCYFIFLDNVGQMIEIWEGNLVGEHRAEGTPLPEDGYEVKVPAIMFKEAVISLFGL